MEYFQLIEALCAYEISLKFILPTIKSPSTIADLYMAMQCIGLQLNRIIYRRHLDYSLS